jgi:DNA-binding transcriptional regulator YiaG
METVDKQDKMISKIKKHQPRDVETQSVRTKETNQSTRTNQVRTPEEVGFPSGKTDCQQKTTASERQVVPP